MRTGRKFIMMAVVVFGSWTQKASAKLCSQAHLDRQASSAQTEANQHRLEMFSMVSAPPSGEWPPFVSVKSMMTSTGDILLFRVIRDEYVKGKMGPFSLKEGFYSYSLNPAIATQWRGKYLLISLQNIASDNLSFPTSIGDRAQLTPTTKVKDIAFFSEVDVLPTQENVVAVVPIERVIAYLSEQGVPPNLYELVAALSGP